MFGAVPIGNRAISGRAGRSSADGSSARRDDSGLQVARQTLVQRVHPPYMDDPVLTACGYEPLEKMPLHVEPGRPSDFAVLASARSPDAWDRLRGSFQVHFDTSAEFTPTKPHYLLGLFADAEDLLRSEWYLDELGGGRRRGELFVELGRTRDRIIREMHGKLNVVACVFFADPAPDENDRLHYSLWTEYEDLVIQDVAQENNILVIHQSTVASEAELDGWDAALTTAKQQREAAEAALAEKDIALAAANRKVDTALAELASATDDPALRVKLQKILSADTTSGAE